MSHSHLPWMSGQTQVQTLEGKTGFPNPPSCSDLKQELSLTRELAGVGDPLLLAHSLRVNAFNYDPTTCSLLY